MTLGRLVIAGSIVDVIEIEKKYMEFLEQSAFLIVKKIT